ncbi:ATP-dependent DNA helicase RecG [Thermodesulfovibrio hydrogeniphilus]
MKADGLNLPIQYLKGVGPKRATFLQKLGIFTVKDALYYLPTQYEDRRNKKNIAEIRPNEAVSIEGKIVQISELKPRANLSIIEVIISDGTGFIKAKWFNQTYLKRIFKEKQKIKIFGKPQIDYWGANLEILNPEYELLEGEINSTELKILPVYRLTEGLSQKQMLSVIRNALDFGLPLLDDFVSEKIVSKLSLPSLDKALEFVHFPPSEIDIEILNEWKSPFHQRLIFDELFLLQLGILLIKQNRLAEKGISFSPSGKLLNVFFEKLPFKLTSAQERVIKEILEDMKKPIPMNRLLQGDVGSGKTVVAVSAMLAAVECGYQAALMAPTEILAEQHYLNISSLLKELPLNIIIYTSTYNKHGNLIASGAADIVIGTHALIQEDVRFKKLGLIVIDEQHRFGVVQRATLKKKGINPDTLVMTATPIPRTMALTVYGELDYSVLDELPAGRKPIITKIVNPENKKVVYKMIEEEVKAGGQVYIVYPLIEESEVMDLKSATQGYEALQRIFPKYKVGLIHGKMPAKERDEVMKEFRQGKIHILVATTVIEVGVDVPNATLMIITHAERFGLAQLHQLRGRVGRGSRPSKCILIPYKLTEEAKLRLSALVKYSDGFNIAEEDMKIRGPGEMFGVKQSGMLDLKVADFIRDREMLEIARQEAENLLKEDPSFKYCPQLKAQLQDYWKDKVEIFLTA